MRESRCNPEHAFEKSCQRPQVGSKAADALSAARTFGCACCRLPSRQAKSNGISIVVSSHAVLLVRVGRPNVGRVLGSRAGQGRAGSTSTSSSQRKALESPTPEKGKIGTLPVMELSAKPACDLTTTMCPSIQRVRLKVHFSQAPGTSSQRAVFLLSRAKRTSPRLSMPVPCRWPTRWGTSH